MRFSLLSLTCLSFLFTLVTALPVLEAREPTKSHTGRAAAPRAGTRNTAHRPPSNAAHIAPAHACALKHKRSIEFEYLHRRNLPDHELPYQIGGKAGGGSFGDVYHVIGHDDLLAKSLRESGVVKKASIEEFKQEAEHLRRVGQLVDWGYKTDASCNKVYYMIMHKIPGTPFGETKEYIATKGKKSERTALVNKVVVMVAEKMLEYGKDKSTSTWHADPNGSNVMCIEDAHHKIVSVDLVDWGLATQVNPDKAHLLTLKIAEEDAKEALAGMYRDY